MSRLAMLGRERPIEGRLKNAVIHTFVRNFFTEATF